MMGTRALPVLESLVWGALPPVFGFEVLENTLIRADFDEHRLAALDDKACGRTVRFARDGVSPGLNGDVVDNNMFAGSAEMRTAGRRVLLYEGGSQPVRVIYELHTVEAEFTSQIAHQD